ncbi:MAG: carbamoyltransferase HypF [Promethearchaeota archaeon]
MLVQVDIEGIVQGVGFRPFLFTLAGKHGLTGWILNRGNAGVRMVLEGSNSMITAFLDDIERKKPKISRIDDITITHLETNQHFDDLEIRKSENGTGPTIVLPADIATCDECVAELMGRGIGGKNNKYYKYPFIACAKCGPRFTTVIDLPYDRPMTTMIDFPLCKDAPEPCFAEYTNVNDRRFHAQTFACPNCGPTYWIEDAGGKILARGIDAITRVAREIKRGSILAMKGIGGVHLLVDASNSSTLKELRKKKRNRKFKPFAVMVASLKEVRQHAFTSPTEETYLSSHRRPIILLKKRRDSTISEEVAPGLSTTGFMLPYMGTHHLLLDECKKNGIGPIVLTSGNVSGLPMAITDGEIRDQLGGIADFFLLHERRIYQRCDDSVAKVCGDDMLLIRRSRGFVPEFIPSPVDIGKSGTIIGIGPELHSCGALFKGNKIFSTQYIGNVTNLETLDFLDDSISHFRKLLRIEEGSIEMIACDAHPGFVSTRYAGEISEELEIPLSRIYHHHAHCAAVVVDNQLDYTEHRVYVTCDGVGYGVDHNAWGGEIFAGPINSLERRAHLAYRKMPGGDSAVKYPEKMLASILHGSMARVELEAVLAKRNIEVRNFVLDQLYGGREMPLTSSTGRILDAASVILGACTEVTYDGEPAIRLEGLGDFIDNVDEDLVRAYISSFSVTNLNEINLAGGLLFMLERATPESSLHERARHAKSFQIAIGRFLGEIACDIAGQESIKEIAMSGGVFLNKFIFPAMKAIIAERGMHAYYHKNVPPGDGGISTGQVFMGHVLSR